MKILYKKSLLSTAIAVLLLSNPSFAVEHEKISTCNNRNSDVTDEHKEISTYNNGDSDVTDEHEEISTCNNRNSDVTDEHEKISTCNNRNSDVTDEHKEISTYNNGDSDVTDEHEEISACNNRNSDVTDEYKEISTCNNRNSDVTDEHKEISTCNNRNSDVTDEHKEISTYNNGDSDVTDEHEEISTYNDDYQNDSLKDIHLSEYLKNSNANNYLEETPKKNFYIRFNVNGTMPKTDLSYGKENFTNVKPNDLISTERQEFIMRRKGGVWESAAIGYKKGNFRVEFEGLTSSLATESKLKNYRYSILNSELEEAIGKKDVLTIYSLNEDGSDQEKLFHDDILNIKKNGIKEHIFPQYIKIKDKDLRNNALMINTYFDVNNSSNFTPYLGVGGGLTSIKFGHTSQIRPAIQGKFGLNYDINDRIQLSAGYRYFTSLDNSNFNEVKLSELSRLRYQVYKPAAFRKKGHGIAFFKDQTDSVSLPISQDTATIESKFSDHALEVGLTLNF